MHRESELQSVVQITALIALKRCNEYNQSDVFIVRQRLIYINA